MVEDKDKKEDSFDSAGEAIEYISLDQARILAMRHARENTDLYGRRYRNRELVWEVANPESDEDYYHISLTFRPAGGFQGEPGVDRISIDKMGEVGFRKVISEPVPKRRWWIPAAGVGVVVVAALVGAIVLLTSEPQPDPTVVPPAPVIPSPGNSPARAIPAPVIVPTTSKAPPDAYKAVSVSLKPSANGNGIEAPVPQEEVANLTRVSRIRITSPDPSQNAEVVVRRLRKVDAPTAPKSVLVLRNLDITPSGIEDSHQTGGEIEFGVKAKWLQDL